LRSTPRACALRFRRSRWELPVPARRRDQARLLVERGKRLAPTLKPMLVIELLSQVIF
jgi:hypothetical protein